MRKSRASEIKSLLRAHTASMAQSGATAEQIARSFLAQHPKVINRSLEDLKMIALIRLVGSVAVARTRADTPTQLDLFEEYDVPPLVPLRVTDHEGTKIVWRALPGITFKELDNHLQERPAPATKTPKDIHRLQVLRENLRPSSLDMTVAQCWEEMKEKKREA